MSLSEQFTQKSQALNQALLLALNVCIVFPLAKDFRHHYKEN